MVVNYWLAIFKHRLFVKVLLIHPLKGNTPIRCYISYQGRSMLRKPSYLNLNSEHLVYANDISMLSNLS